MKKYLQYLIAISLVLVMAVAFLPPVRMTSQNLPLPLRELPLLPLK